jgi:hypothetical protein
MPHQRLPGPGQLQAHHQRQQAAQQKEHEGGDGEAAGDGLVVQRGELAFDARRVAPGGVQRGDHLGGCAGAVAQAGCFLGRVASARRRGAGLQDGAHRSSPR